MDNNSSEIVFLYLDDIIPNRFQPREVFNDQALKELAVSIREHGVIQPIIVRKVDNKYEIIAGERRYKASTMAGLTKIPAIVKNLDDKESSKVALIENLQRRDLTPIEEARTYQKILELEDNMTQEQLAATMGKTQSSVSNKLRLLALPEEIQDALLKEKISERHARGLLNIEDKNDQIKMMERIISEKLTVRELDKAIKELKNGPDVDNGTEVNVEIGNSTPAIASITPALDEIKSEELTANDIVGEVNVPSVAETNLLNNNNNIENTNVPSFNIASFGTKTENEPQNEEPQMNNNPTVVDINQIRENSVDIGANKPNGDIKNLFTPENENNTADNNNNEGGEDFKFVPSFEFSKNNENNTDTNNNQQENKFSGFFNTNVNKESNETNNVASSISNVGITVPSTGGKNITSAIDDIKKTVSSLEQNGYSVSLEENDGITNYKITITLEK